MLDGLLGRGFSSKCKVTIKAIRARIQVVRRRAEAKQRFLTDDLVKLLSNGLDINAYGRTEEYVVGLSLLSCYDFIEQSCDYIVKQLSRMQKQGECPEECRETVACLMFAAARFSDLPELRDLRDIFLEKYGNSLESFVNEKFVEQSSSRRPTTKQQRLQALKDIASEFSIMWDSRGFEQRMSTPVSTLVTTPKNDEPTQRAEIFDNGFQKHKYGGVNVVKKDEFHKHTKVLKESNQRLKSLVKREEITSVGGHNILHHGRRGLTEDKNSYLDVKSDASSGSARSNRSYHGKVLENNGVEYTNGASATRRGEITESSSRGKPEIAPRSSKPSEKHLYDISSHDHISRNNMLNSTGKALEGSHQQRSCYNSVLPPPPYTKSEGNFIPPPYTKPSGYTHRGSIGSKHASPDHGGDCIDPALHSRSNAVKSLDRRSRESDTESHEGQSSTSGKIYGNGHEKEYIHQDGAIPLPRPRSIRRKHRKSSSHREDAAISSEDGATVKRSSSSRRRDRPRQGLQVLLDDERSKKDDEERMLDKLLIHYSKNAYDPGKLRRKMQARPSCQITPDGSELPPNASSSGHDKKPDMVPRSVSLPHQQTDSQEVKKVFARANSFHPDSQAKHVHPKLPDYDDLAARFSALKGR